MGVPRWRRLTLVGVGVVALVAASTAWAEPGSPQTGRLSQWHPCDDDPDEPKVQCAELTVPVDWADPDGEQVELNVKRKRAADPDKRIGTLMTGPGGPGQPGTVIVTDGYLPDSVSEAYDLIGYDSRGVGATKAKCDEAPEVNPLPRDEQEFDAFVETNRSYGESCATEPAALIDHLDAASDARDMEAIRQALGEEKLNYYGASYGTLRGQVYASLYPAHTGRMVLDGNMDHSITDAADMMDTETRAAEESLNRFFSWCDDNPECALHDEGAERVFAEVYADAVAADETDPGHVYDLVQEATVGAANGEIVPDSWTDLADEIAKRRDMSTPPASRLPLDGPNQAIFCSDWNLPVDDYDTWTDMLAGIADEYPNLRISDQALVSSGAFACIGWPHPTGFPQRRLPQWNVDPEVLMVGSLHDVRTPVSWRDAAAEQSGAVRLTYDGGGHVVSWGEATSGLVEKYLLTGTPPADGTHCDDSGCRAP